MIVFLMFLLVYLLTVSVIMAEKRERGIMLLSTPFSKVDVQQEARPDAARNWHQRKWLYHYRGKQWMKKTMQQHNVDDESWLQSKTGAILGACLVQKWTRIEHRGVSQE